MRRSQTADAVLDIADTWALLQKQIYVIEVLEGRLSANVLEETLHRSQLMLGVQLGIAMSAVDLDAAIGFRQSVAEQLVVAGSAHPDISGHTNQNEISNILNRYAAVLVETFKGENRG